VHPPNTCSFLPLIDFLTKMRFVAKRLMDRALPAHLSPRPPLFSSYSSLPLSSFFLLVVDTDLEARIFCDKAKELIIFFPDGVSPLWN